MKLRSLFDERRRREIREDMARGRPIVRRTRYPDHHAEGLQRDPMAVLTRAERSLAGIPAKDRLLSGIIDGKLERVKQAHEDGADLNLDISKEGFYWAGRGFPCRSPLHLARSLGKKEIEKYLEEHGARD